MSKSKQITISRGDDKGKVLIIKRMPAVKGDRFMMRLLHGLASNGVSISEAQRIAGALGVDQLIINMIGLLSEELFLSLMDEMLEYVDILPEGGEARKLEKDIDVKDSLTFIDIRMAFVEVHTDFLAQGNS